MSFVYRNSTPSIDKLKSNLKHWFRFDHLDPASGIALLVGVSPNYGETCKNWHTSAAEDKAALTFGIDLLNGVEITVFPVSDDPEIPDFGNVTDEEEEFLYDCAREKFRPYIAQHYRLMSYWNSGNHPDVTPPSYYVKWAASKGISPEWLSVAEEMGLIPATDQTDAKTTTGRAHVSDDLAILNQAAAKFWANMDRDDRTTYPKKQDVVSWLMGRGFSQITAESGATIINPTLSKSTKKQN